MFWSIGTRGKLEAVATVALVLAAVAMAGSAVVSTLDRFRGNWVSTTADSAPPPPVSPPYSLVKGWQEIRSLSLSVGDTSGPMQVLVVADLECPFCAAFHASLATVRSEFPGVMAEYHVHFPLPNHRFAMPAARVVECAASARRLPEMLDLLYSKQDSLGLKSWADFAREAGIQDTARISKCARGDSAISARIGFVRDSAASTIFIRGTPTVLINGWRFRAPPSTDELRRLATLLAAGRDPFKTGDSAGIGQPRRPRG